MAIQITPWGFVSSQLEVPGPGQRGEAGFDRPFPGEGLTGGEGNKAWELHGFKAHLWVLGIEARVVGDGVSTVSGGLRGLEHGGGVTPVANRQGERAGELR